MPRKPKLTQSLSRAIAILEALEDHGRPMGVTEIAREIGVHKSSVYRLLRTMVEYDLLEQHAGTSRYWFGTKLALLGHLASFHLDLPLRARPHVERLAQATRETANFVKLQGDKCLYLVSVPTNQSIGMLARPFGSTDAIYSTAVGKAMLAFMEPGRAESILNRTKFVRRTERTLTTADAVLAQLPAIRQRGYAVDDEENEPHVTCIGAPVFDSATRVVGAVSISGPGFRLGPEAISALAPYVIQAAVEVSASLGCPRDRHPLAGAASGTAAALRA